MIGEPPLDPSAPICPEFEAWCAEWLALADARSARYREGRAEATASEGSDAAA